MARAKRFLALLSLPLAWLACSDGAFDGSPPPAGAGNGNDTKRPTAPPSTTPPGVAPPTSTAPPTSVPPADGGNTPGVDGASPDAASGADATSQDPCPALPIPTTCFNRTVVYREWNANAKGDGTYFASQAPYRLGFNRSNGNIWIVKFRVDANTYMGRLSAYGDGTPGIAWISDKPCDESFALTNKLVTWGNSGGGMLMFDVARDATDANRLRTDPAYAARKNNPQLRGGHCYYAAFENTESPTTTIDASLWSSNDTCGSVNGTSDCYYLAFDMFHYLQDPISGQRMAGAVIPGLTQ